MRDISKMFALWWKSVKTKMVGFPQALVGILGLFGIENFSYSDPLFWIIFAISFIIFTYIAVLIKAYKLKQSICQNPPNPDESISFAFKHLMVEAEWALNKDPKVEDFYIEVEGELRDSASLKILTVWARPEEKLRGGFKETLIKLESNFWEGARFDIVSCAFGTNRAASIIKGPYINHEKYEDTKINTGQVLDVWPKADRYQKKADKFYNARVDFFKKELKTYSKRKNLNKGKIEWNSKNFKGSLKKEEKPSAGTFVVLDLQGPGKSEILGMANTSTVVLDTVNSRLDIDFTKPFRGDYKVVISSDGEVNYHNLMANKDRAVLSFDEKYPGKITVEFKEK